LFVAYLVHCQLPNISTEGAWSVLGYGTASTYCGLSLLSMDKVLHAIEHAGAVHHIMLL
jgi:hypothetical protein